MNSGVNNRERGIALIIVLFALLLLSVIGLGMMYSTNMETSINSNYRDKQVAFYAALAGLQEARDRIQPATHNIVAPTALPSTTAANIIYIVANYATVKPWDSSTPSPYFDTELCQEQVLSLTRTVGVPCPTIASGTSWFSYVDDSLSSSAPWNLTSPLDLKWTRIELKGNNMTPVAVNGDSTSSAQTCWNGVSQMSTPTGYTTGCMPTGGVTAVTMITSGTGYTSTGPTVNFSGGGGTGAVGTVNMLPETTGIVSSVTITTGGSGYTSAPVVTFSGSSGTGATGTAVLASPVSTTTGGSVITVSVGAGGSGYAVAPTVSFGGPGSGATATAVLSATGTNVTSGYVSAISLTTGGTAYTSAPTVNFTSAGGGNGAAATATLATAGSVISVTLSSVGTQCYSQASDVVIAISGGGGSGATATATLEPGRSCVYSWTAPSSPQCTNKLSAADGYSPINQKAGVSAQTGNKSFSGTLFVRSADEKSPSSTSTQNPGYDATNYSAATFSSQLQLTGGAWADCGNVTATMTTGYRIASINVTAGGSGYTSDPTVTITGGVGSTSSPAATATRGFAVASLTLTAGGNGYNAAPTVSFSGGGGSGAAATDSVITNSSTTYAVASVVVNSGGNGYTSAPTVTFTALSGGSGATATATVLPVTATTYSVGSVTIGGGGSGYSAASPPTVTFSGGGGSGAAGTANITTMNLSTYWVASVSVSPQGSGYTSNPTVSFAGGGGSGATATSQISGGTKFGQVYLLTSFAQTKTGARSMLQMETATPVMGFATGGAITLDGPNPIIGAMPHSSNLTVDGHDQNTCGQTPDPVHPAIDGYDDPNANPPTNSVSTIVSAINTPANYIGAGGTPSVQNGYAALGETMTTPPGLSSLIGAIQAQAAILGTSYNASTPPPSAFPSNTTKASITFVDGDLTLNGNASGAGILVVTGLLTMGGNFDWQGLVLVVGEGNLQMMGGGHMNINGEILVSNIYQLPVLTPPTHSPLLSAIGPPTFNFNGGGTNMITYDHCLSTNLMTAVPWTVPPTTNPLKVLSFRILPY